MDACWRRSGKRHPINNVNANPWSCRQNSSRRSRAWPTCSAVGSSWRWRSTSADRSANCRPTIRRSRGDRLVEGAPTISTGDSTGGSCSKRTPSRVSPSVWSDARRCGQRSRACTRAAWQRDLVRGFVPRHHMDWNNERSRAAYDNFRPLDGQFDANAIDESTYLSVPGARPASPLGALERTIRSSSCRSRRNTWGRRATRFTRRCGKKRSTSIRRRGGASPVKALVSANLIVRSVALSVCRTWA